MKVTAVDNQNNLFYVEDFYPQDLINLAAKENFLTHKSDPVLVQGQYTRRNLNYSKLVEKFENASKKGLDEIAKIINQKLKLTSIAVWVDLENYYMDKHLDSLNHVSAGMQIYIKEAPENLGTCFYNQDGSLRFQLPYKVNCGYFMINGLNQIHSMPTAVPKNCHRVSVYHWINL